MRKITPILAIAAGLLLALLLLTTRHKEPDEGFDFVPDEKQSFASAGESLVWYTPTELRQYDLEGNTKNSVSLEMEEPHASAANDRCLVWDCGGRTLCLVCEDGTMQSFTAPGRLLYAEIGESGIVLCTKKAGFAACVTILDSEFCAVYKWYSAEAEVLSAALSPDGRRLAVARTDEVLMLSTESGESLAAVTADGLPLAACWLDDERLCVLTETAAYISDTSGDTDKYDFNGKTLGLYAFGDGAFALELRRHRSGGDGEIVCLDRELEPCGRAKTEMLISLSVGDGELLALDRSKAVLYDLGMRQRDETELSGGITVLHCGDRAVIIRNSHVDPW